MRLVSQDGEIDVPYEHGSLCQGFIKGEEHLVYTISYYNYSSQKGTKLAEYSSKDKALKVMEMVRKQYMRNNALYIDRENNARVMPQNSLFQFPADDEVEV